MVEFDGVFAQAYSAYIASVSHDTILRVALSASGARFRSSRPTHDPTQHELTFGATLIARSAVIPPRWTPENRPSIDSSKPATTSVVTETCD
jgi:hypothetical protein